MEGELVSPRPSGKPTENAADEPFPMTAKFEECLPFYISIGMPPDVYWDGECTFTRIFLKAHEMRIAERNHLAWLQGLYVYDAVSCLVPVLHAFADKNCKPFPYPSEPYPITSEEIAAAAEENKIKKENKMRENMQRSFMRINAYFKAHPKEGENNRRVR